MIDTSNEELLTLTEAANQLPRRRRGRKTHVATLHRWVSRGCKGVKLEAVQVGGTRCTTREALERFYERLGQKSGLVATTAYSVRSPNQRARAAERASSALAKMGV